LAKPGLIVSYHSSNVAAQQPEECSEQQANTDESETEADDPAAGCPTHSRLSKEWDRRSEHIPASKGREIANSCPPYIILLRFLITSKGEDKTMMKRGSVVSMLSFALLLSAISLQAQSKDAVEKALQGKEQAGWQAWKDKNPKAFDDILPENSINIAGGSMDNGKSNIIKGMTTANCEVASFSLSDFSYMWLDKDTVLMTYKASQDGSCGGTKIAPKVIASSIWQKQGGKWVSPFHQETVTSSM
jgi:hypothetical protein